MRRAWALIIAGIFMMILGGILGSINLYWPFIGTDFSGIILYQKK